MKIIKYILIVLIVAAIGLGVFSYFKKNDLPNNDLILEALNKVPVQEEIDLSVKPFEIKKEGFTYKITPLYKYEIFGLSVAEYDAENLFDIFHKKDPLNKKDICLVWGNNIGQGYYEDIKFKHGEFTCYWQAQKENVFFSNNEISNNHLLPAGQDIYEEFKKARVGDQVYIKGYLVNYQVIGLDTNFTRSSSISRDDTGNNSCEVIYVTDFKILLRGNLGWRLLYRFSMYLFLFLIVIYLIISFIIFTAFPSVKKRKVIKEIDINVGKGRSFPSTFRDRD